MKTQKWAIADTGITNQAAGQWYYAGAYGDGLTAPRFRLHSVYETKQRAEKALARLEAEQAKYKDRDDVCCRSGVSISTYEVRPFDPRDYLTDDADFGLSPREQVRVVLEGMREERAEEERAEASSKRREELLNSNYEQLEYAVRISYSDAELREAVQYLASLLAEHQGWMGMWRLGLCERELKRREERELNRQERRRQKQKRQK